MQFELRAVVAEGLVELLLAGDLAGDVELATDLGRGVEEGDGVAALGGGDRAGKTRGARADDGDTLAQAGGREDEFGLVAGARVDEAGGDLAAERVVQAGLVAADAGVDRFRALGLGLGHEVRVGEQGPREGHHVGAAVGEQLLGDLGGVDAVRGDERDGDLAHDLLGDEGVRAARHRRRDGRDAGLVPADAGVDDGGAGGLDLLGELHDLFEGGAAGHEVDHREPVDEDEVRADALADAADDLDGEADAVLVRAAPAVGAPVRRGDDELVDQVALGAHDLHTVVTRPPGEFGGAREVLDGLLDLGVGEFVRREGTDRRLERARGDEVLVVGVAAEVEDLHRDLPARRVHRVGDLAVLVGLRLGGQLRAAGPGASGLVGGDAAGDHEADTAAGAGGVELRHTREAVLRLLESHVHGAHQDPVGQRGESEVERGEQVRVSAHGGPPCAANVVTVVDDDTALLQQVA